MVRNGGPAFRHAGATAACSNNPMPRSLREQGCALPYVNCASQGICRNAKRRLSEPPSASVTKRQSAAMARQFIYHMQGLSKAFSGGKKVLENVHLSFYPDAKIGVLGPNGSGKSTLLRIMAGLDKEFSGEAWAAEGARVGYLPQEPRARSVEGRERQRHAGRRGEAGDPRPLQRADGELLRRDRGRGVEAAGRDRRARTSGTSNRRSRCRWRRSAARRATPT